VRRCEHLVDRSATQLVAVLAWSCHNDSLLSPAPAQESALHQTRVGSRIINATTGELLRHLTLDPTRDYQPINTPKAKKPGP
jgi:hypothetical protein